MTDQQRPTTPGPTPRTDDDTFDVIEEALTALAERRGLWLGDEHAHIHLVASLREQADRCLPEAVTTARANGSSWSDIAHLLDTSPNEAWMRFSPASPVADSRWPHN